MLDPACIVQLGQTDFTRSAIVAKPDAMRRETGGFDRVGDEIGDSLDRPLGDEVLRRNGHAAIWPRNSGATTL